MYEVAILTIHPKTAKLNIVATEKARVRYRESSAATEMRINQLIVEFDSQLLRMQRPSTRRSMQGAFEASGKELGRAAVAAVHKRD